jgi:hypothetical protein
MTRGLTGAALLMLAACGGPTTAPSPGAAGGLYTSAHFRFQYTPLDAANIERTAEAVEREYARIIADLRVGSMPTVTVTFYTDHAAMAAATRAVAGVVPPWASGLVTSQSEIHMMSLNAPGWGPYDRRLSGLVHEFAHCVSMRLNPAIPNRPRWLWEAVAIYEAGESVDLRGLDYMRALTPPSFEMLNSFDNTRIYEVGYSIAEFVVTRWGSQALADLVTRSGDTVAVLNISLPDFERDWFAFARQRYAF